MSIIVCRPKTLPFAKLAVAERRALEMNPANASERRSVARSPIGHRGGPRRVAVLVARKWPATGVRLSVSFMDGPSSALRARILGHMNAWGKTANVSFVETEGTGEVRIARLDSPPDMAGYWSYLGTEILEIPKNEPTLNLQGFTMRVSEAEFRRVVRHEAGHTLGFEHEHMRSDLVNLIDRKKAIAFFDREQGWAPEEVEAQVLTPLSKKSIMGTEESDPLSIMCYQLPGAITKDGRPIRGGKDINAKDSAFAASLYPRSKKASAATPDTPEAPTEAGLPARLPNEEEGGTFEIVVMGGFQAENDGARRTPSHAQVFATYGGARVTETMRLRAERGEKRTRFGQVIRVHERIKAYTNREHGSLPDGEELTEFGAHLFEALFIGQVRRLYDEARTRQRRQRLSLVLTSMIPWIAEKPWEFAYDPARRSFLATEEIHFVRNVLTNVPSDPIVRRQAPLRILVAAAQPVGFGRLSADQEAKIIRRGFEPLVEMGLVVVEVLSRATADLIHRCLSSGDYQVVHFIGHGIYDEDRQEGCLVFEDSSGNEQRLGERQVREIFSGRGLSLVFLNACESGRGGRADFNKGVAQSLVARGLPALVANQYSVLDSSASSFAQHFYWSLAQGMSLGQSAREARIAVNYSLQGELIDWAVPVLYARDPNATLCEIPARTPRRWAKREPTRHSASGGREVRVAVWDVDHVFPSLDRTLDGMNAVQGIFGFELADISVPIDAWDLESTEGTAYLWAERVAKRLRGKTVELHVDLLACVTRHWMRDDEWLNLYGWWPDGKKHPIVIFSVAGFGALPPDGPEADRAIANVTVTGLAGFYGDIASHQRGASNCPLFFDRHRDLQHLVGNQAFDARCRRTLSRRLGSRLKALEAILTAFSNAG